MAEAHINIHILVQLVGKNQVVRHVQPNLQTSSTLVHRSTLERCMCFLQAT